MALQDNPLLGIHPEYQKIYNDLLSRLALAQADLEKRLRKDQADGALRPYRVFRSVGNTLVGATVRVGQTAAITDLTSEGRVYSITSIRLKTIALPGVSSTITIKSNGITIFSKTLLLANISAIGALTDLLGIGTQMPVDLTLPATLTCSASSGTFDIIVDGLLN